MRPERASEPPAYVTTSDAAKLMRKSVDTFHRYRRSGLLDLEPRPWRNGHEMVFLLDDVVRALRKLGYSAEDLA